ncbi:MAG: riboflavin biosynthesis protein RibF [Treponema sp.]|jgi:riboflavin kinase/FMN adenylyltransferase|nr:riboflavin biosynthesis protein RibF [Treponema sp.]
MRVIDWADFISGKAPPDDFPGDQPLSLSIGVFDGVHRGHQELIRRITAESPAATVITFRQNPRQVLSPEKHQGDIFSLKQKLAVLESLGVSRAVLIDFSGNFSRLTGRDFIGLLKKSCRIGYMALGVNFRCGHRLDTGARSIRTWMMEDGLTADLVEPVMEGRHPVSSSRIRSLVSAGDLAAAAALMGRALRIDLSGMAVSDGGEGRCYDAASVSRITPRPGSYRVLVRGAGAGRETTVFIKDRKIFIPAKTGDPVFGVEDIEFIS